jgi:hypothetical protein
MPFCFIIKNMAHVLRNEVKYLLVTVVLTLCIAILISVDGPRDHFLIVRAIDNGEVIFKAVVSEGSRFSTTFKHSVQLSNWTDFYEITNNYEIKLYETRFSDFGWGFPSEPDAGAKMEVTDKYVRYYDMNRIFSSFRLSVTTAADTHYLEFGETFVDLIDKAGPGRILEFVIDN